MKNNKKEELEFIVAPYLASTQIYYLYNKGAVQAVYGPLDLLYFTKVPIIVVYDDKQFQWTSDEIIMEKLELTRKKLEEYSLLWTYPIEQVDCTKELLSTTEAASNKPSVKLALTKFQTLYKYPIIFDNECICRTMIKSQKLPKEIEELLGIKLPTKCYLYLFLGLLSGKFLTILSSGKLFEYSPIYREEGSYSYNMNHKGRNYGVLISFLKGCVGIRPYIEKFNKLLYIDRIENVESVIVGESLKELYWNVTKDKVTKELERQAIKSEQVGALFCIRWFSEMTGKGNNLKKVDKFVEIRQARELVCHVILTYLEYHSYISKTKGISSIGQTYKSLPVEFQDEGLIFFELLIYKQFNKPKDKTAQEIAKELIVEVFSLISMKLKIGVKADWDNYLISKEFNYFVLLIKDVWNTLRDFVEGVLFDLFCNNDESKIFDIGEFEKAFELLPFRVKPNFLLGVLMLWLFNVPESENLLEEISKVFPIGEDIISDITRGYKFWRSVMTIITSLHTYKDINQMIYEQFMDANKLLEARLEILGIKVIS